MRGAAGENPVLRGLALQQGPGFPGGRDLKQGYDSVIKRCHWRQQREIREKANGSWEMRSPHGAVKDARGL